MLTNTAVKGRKLTIEEKYEIVKSYPDYQERVYELSKDEYLIYRVQVRFKGKK